MPALLHEAILRGADAQPNQEAFRFRKSALTYSALAERMHQLANCLRARGLRSMDRVGIFMPKGLEQSVAVHGIMAAGGVYVPIDPASPPERLSFILRDCGIQHLITHPGRKAVLRQVPEIATTVHSLIGLDPDGEGATSPWPTVSWGEVATFPARSPNVRISVQDLAYVMYTSGSTGAPKGLMHTHASGLAYAELAAQTYDLRASDRMGNHSPLHFDMSTLEFLAAPLVGATTILVPDEVKLFPVALSRLVEEERLTIWYSVPLALVQMLTRGEAEHCDWQTLRWVLYGGEPFPPKFLRALMAKCPRARFSNVYGPAEVNQCTYFHFDASYPVSDDASVPLGRAWGHTETRVLDAHDRPVDPGETGELVVRTPTMMQGYWGRPDLTARAWFETEEAPGFTKRYYRTGDLVRLDEDGVLTFLGRRDRQIKIRGYRLELDEVELALTSHSAVAEVAVVAGRDGEGESTVIAFVEARSGETVTPDELMRHAKARLPSYGVPSQIRFRVGFPRTGSGKIDRPALVAELNSP